MNYSDEKWIRIRDIILKRDNFTCQICGDFNPQLGSVEIENDKNSDIEFHYYLSSPIQSTYRFSSYQSGLTIELDFGTDWLVLPVLQIHHKRYIQGRKIWEYDAVDLVTLCKQCHTKLHLSCEIPVYSQSGIFLRNENFTPEDFSSGRKHNYKSWIFIREDSKKGEYRVTGVHPAVNYIVFENQDPKELAAKADLMVANFFTRYLPDYKK